jgi:threonine synthase
MDILVSSNLERMLYYLTDGDCEAVAGYMADLAQKGYYTISNDLLAKLRQTFDCGFATDDETRQTIRGAWEKDHVLIDTHTAVALHVLRRFAPEGRQRVCLSTASPYKFSADVLSALGTDVSGLDGFACMDRLQALTGVAAPAQLSGLRDAPVLHADVCDMDGMTAFVEGSCNRVFA